MQPGGINPRKCTERGKAGGGGDRGHRKKKSNIAAAFCAG